MSKPNLKPCPFCGGPAILAENYGDWVASCKDDCEVGINFWKESAIESWNTRAEDERGQKALELVLDIAAKERPEALNARFIWRRSKEILEGEK